MKRTMITLLTLLVMVLTTSNAVADNVRTSGPYTYQIKGNGTITITDFNWEQNDGDVYIPNLIDGYIVTGIGDYAFSLDSKNNKKYAITLPESIKTIGSMTFAQANITEINIPVSLQHIGSGAFYGCPSCQFKIAPNHPYFAVIDEGLYNKSAKELLAYSWNNAEITKNSFLEEVNVIIPEGIVSIGAYAFGDLRPNQYLVDRFNISLPSTLTFIQDYAFVNAEWIYSLTGNLPKLKSIGKGAFQNTAIHNCSLTMPDVEVIEDYAFCDAGVYSHSSYSLNFGNSPLKKIGAYAFDEYYEEASINIPLNNCSEIGPYNRALGRLMVNMSVFSPFLTTIPTELSPQVTSLPNTVTTIDSGAFYSKVSDFYLHPELRNIAVDAFKKGSTFIVDSGSYAELWCSENGFGYTVNGQEDDLSWLN